MISYHSRKAFTIAFKTALGTMLAIMIAQGLGLNYYQTAGTICMITMLNPKMETLNLIVRRFISFFASALLSALIFPHIPWQYVACGLFLAIISFVSVRIGWQNTLSVNALIGLHIMAEQDFSLAFYANELALLTVALMVAFVLSLVDDYRGQEKHLFAGIHPAEMDMDEGLKILAGILKNEERTRASFLPFEQDEKKLNRYLQEADYFAANTFNPITDYFTRYYIMRFRQYKILKRLIKRALMVKEYSTDASEVIATIETLEKNLHLSEIPTLQLKTLKRSYEKIDGYPMPETREALNERSALIEIMIGLRAFLECKRDLIESLSPEQKTLYRYRNDAASISQALKNPVYYFEEDKEPFQQD